VENNKLAHLFFSPNCAMELDAKCNNFAVIIIGNAWPLVWRTSINGKN
jgi:hypothetical protein